MMATAVLETATFGFEDRRAIHCATLPEMSSAGFQNNITTKTIRYIVSNSQRTYAPPHVKEHDLFARLSE